MVSCIFCHHQVNLYLCIVSFQLSLVVIYAWCGKNLWHLLIDCHQHLCVYLGGALRTSASSREWQSADGSNILQDAGSTYYRGLLCYFLINASLCHLHIVVKYLLDVICKMSQRQTTETNCFSKKYLLHFCTICVISMINPFIASCRIYPHTTLWKYPATCVLAA